MASTIIEIAKAVVTVLTEAQDADPGDDVFSLPVTIERQYVPLIDLQSLDDAIRAYVVPAAVTATLAARSGDTQFDYAVDVAIVQRLAGEVTSEILDARMGLVEEIMDLFRARALTLESGLRAICLTAQNAPIYDPAQLDQKKAFVSLVTLNIRAVH